MFIIECEDDKSFCQIPNKDVIFDAKNPPTKGTIVKFFWQGAAYTGEVLLKSDNVNLINKTYETLKKNKKQLSRVPKAPTPKKRNPKKRSFTPPPHENEKDRGSSPGKKKLKKNERVSMETKKKGIEATQSFLENLIADKKLEAPKSVNKKKSPSKEELKRLLKEAQDKIASQSNVEPEHHFPSEILKPSSSYSKIARHEMKKKTITTRDDSYTASESESDQKENTLDTDPDSTCSGDKSAQFENDSEVENKVIENIVVKTEDTEIEGGIDDMDLQLADESDLFGKNWPGDKMVKLVNHVYCKESELRPALAMASQASHLARRLITGVFKPSGYLNATLTGQAPRAHKDKQGIKNPVQCLNEVAKNEILEFALMRARKKGWKNKDGSPQTRKEIRHAMSQKIGELKRKHEANEKLAEKKKKVEENQGEH